MTDKPTYAELEKRVNELEKETQKKVRTDGEMKESETQYRQIVETMGEALGVTNSNYVLTYVNENFCKLLEYSRDEMVGHHLSEFIHDDYKSLMEEQMAMRIKGEVEKYEMAWKTKSGNTKYTTAFPKGLFDKQENFIGSFGLLTDITARKRAEEALRKTEQKYHMLIEQANDGIIIIQDGRVRYVNQRLADLLGYTREEMTGTPDIGYVHPELVSEAIERNKRRMAEETVEEAHANILRHKDGTGIDVEVNAVAILFEGRISHLVFVRDITARKRVEEERNELYEKFRLIAENSNDDIWQLDLTGKVTYASPAVETIFGYTPQEALELDFKCFFPETEIPKATKAFMKAVSGELHQLIRLEAIRKDGSPIPIEISITPIFKDDSTIGIQGIARDITIQKRAEEALQASEEKYRTLVESTTDSIYVVDKDCNYIFMNQKHLLRFKLSLEKVLGRPYGEFHSEQETKNFSEKIKAVIEDNIPISYEYRSQRKDRYFFRTLSPVKGIDGKITSVTVISKDISEIKQAEKDLKVSNEELWKAHNQRKILSKRLIDLLEKDRQQTAMELHDHIGQTLTSLKVSLEIAHGKLTPDHTEMEDQITMAKERAVQALKDIKKISLGLRPSTLDTLGLVPSLRELFNTVQQQTNIEIDFFSRRIPKQIENEKELAIYRIAQEALTNIVKHAQTRKAFVNLTRKDNKFLLSLEDDGIGFDLEDKMMVSKKTGPLGLIIMRERALQLGGEFRIESQKNRGTHVLLEIPF